MAYTYDELRGKTIAELREIAKDVSHDAVQGFSQMNKEHLLPALCTALGVDVHEHHVAVGIDKPALKAKIKGLKQERDAALVARDHDTLKNVRRQIHRITRDIRRHLQ
jgi:DNA-binding IclR family transcriptional regulator